MGLELPGWLTEPLGWIGLTWPQADEEKLFAAGTQWMSFGGRLQTAAATANGAAEQVWTQNEGGAVDAFHTWWTKDDGPQQRFAEDTVAAYVIGSALVVFAVATLALKIAFIVQLVMLAIAVAQAIAAAFVTFGATAAEVPGFIAATRVVCRQLIRQVVRHVTTVIKDILKKAKALLKKVAKKGGRRAESRALRAGEKDLAKAPLNDVDRAALRDYTTNDGYSTMNPFLRNPDKYNPADRAVIQARADRVSEGLAKLPGEPGTTFRGVQYSDDVLARYQPGQVVTERAFTSTSRDVSVAQGGFNGNTLMTITGRNGKDVQPFSQYATEAEILYDKGTNFQVLSKTWNPDIGKWMIHLQEVP